MTAKIVLAESDQQIDDCYPVMSELRPQIRVAEFLERIKRQATLIKRMIISSHHLFIDLSKS